uniref:Uncharacterized protein n=1 Tax=Chromera velia CCMP2878 TaxID=1169474 RepID=A0A0G4FLZ5_9ALVE|eukprot:Cvel_17707.t1-p1 / transcript=Cvel_17707.t1 / gene=Cvel_17707 / organism=Chromera_velia_CCMP2878 / gene_product=hypothetical protein / transcript_product=hypothetical protein / location=Cvel_scaffold1429:32065-34702(-) / protein_length=560 / sequence_SO=supercontig / SO=protein_coding / is_pseudo=false
MGGPRGCGEGGERGEGGGETLNSPCSTNTANLRPGLGYCCICAQYNSNNMQGASSFPQSEHNQSGQGVAATGAVPRPSTQSSSHNGTDYHYVRPGLLGHHHHRLYSPQVGNSSSFPPGSSGGVFLCAHMNAFAGTGAAAGLLRACTHDTGPIPLPRQHRHAPVSERGGDSVLRIAPQQSSSRVAPSTPEGAWKSKKRDGQANAEVPLPADVLEEEEGRAQISDDGPGITNLPYSSSPPLQQFAPLTAERGQGQITKKKNKQSSPASASPSQCVFRSAHVRAQILDFALRARQYDPLLLRLCGEGVVPPYFCTPEFECVRLGEEDRESWKLEIDFLSYGGNSCERDYVKWGCDLGEEGLVGVRRRGDTERWARPLLDTKSEDPRMKYRVWNARDRLRSNIEKIQQGEFRWYHLSMRVVSHQAEKVRRSRHWPWMDEELEVYMKEPEKSRLWWETHEFEKGEALRLNLRGCFAPRRFRLRFPPDRPPPVMPPKVPDPPLFSSESFIDFLDQFLPGVVEEYWPDFRQTRRRRRGEPEKLFWEEDWDVELLGKWPLPKWPGKRS